MTTSIGSDSDQGVVGKPQAPPTVQAPSAVQVRRRVAAARDHVWEVLVSPAGSSALLGDGAVLGAKGEPYHCADGTGGVLRSYHPLEQLRVSWHGTTDGPPTIVEVDLRADGSGTVLELTQSHLVDGSDTEGLRARWAAALASVATVVEA